MTEAIDVYMNLVQDEFAIYFEYDLAAPPNKLPNSTRFILISVRSQHYQIALLNTHRTLTIVHSIFHTVKFSYTQVICLLCPTLNME